MTLGNKAELTANQSGCAVGTYWHDDVCENFAFHKEGHIVLISKQLKPFKSIIVPLCKMFVSHLYVSIKIINIL